MLNDIVMQAGYLMQRNHFVLFWQILLHARNDPNLASVFTQVLDSGHFGPLLYVCVNLNPIPIPNHNYNSKTHN